MVGMYIVQPPSPKSACTLYSLETETMDWVQRARFDRFFVGMLDSATFIGE